VKSWIFSYIIAYPPPIGQAGTQVEIQVKIHAGIPR
jgi:hypothetical protein